jgi:hypothetical protein
MQTKLGSTLHLFVLFVCFVLSFVSVEADEDKQSKPGCVADFTVLNCCCHCAVMATERNISIHSATSLTYIQDPKR